MQYYHAVEGRFADNAFLNSVDKYGQIISFCGVGAHHQNGLAKNRIPYLRQSARKILLHSISRWPEADNIHLWPYALRNTANVSNMIPDKLDGTSKLERFS